jgi:EAL domain-containing protein (putative c-di-GMP-specific phosphodiesterase class I)
MSRRHATTGAGMARRAMGLPRPAQGLLVAALLGLCWAVVSLAGGPDGVWVHLFAIPIVLAAVPFGIPGSLAAAVAATVLAGPATLVGGGEAPAQWLARGAVLGLVALAAGGARLVMETHHAHTVSERLRSGLAEITVSGRTIPNGDPTPPIKRDDAAVVDEILRRQRFRPVFQPIYGLQDGELVAVEALTRFDDEPETAPNVWFTRAEAVGRGVELEVAAIDAALERSRMLPPDVTVSLNCSPATIADVRLTEVLDRHLARAVYVEVTEHAIVEDYRELATAIAMLRRRGVQVAVDDAGAGFSSFRHLVRLEPEIIKLDRSVTESLRTDPVRRALASSFIDFARRTGSRLVAEGIEQPGDLSTWQSLGAHAAQGFLLGRPGPLAASELDGRARRHPLICSEAS